MKTKNNNQPLKYITTLLVYCVVSFAAHAQQTQDLKDIVLYDPLFWKEKLKLKDAQCKYIQRVNIEYYENLKRAFQDFPQDRATVQLRAAQYLVQRSQKIWDTFRPNQRRRWKKLWDHHYAEHKSGKHNDEPTSMLTKPPFLFQL